jgi:hypothetical protein
VVPHSRWKGWALAVAYALCALEGLVVLKLAHKEPDIVLIAPDGRSTYLNRRLAGNALVRFLEEQRQLPSKSVRASHIRVSVSLESLDFVERTHEAMHLHAAMLRRIENFAEGTLQGLDRLEVDPYESVVPRSAAHPDGLVVGQFTSRSEKVDRSATPKEPFPRAP